MRKIIWAGLLVMAVLLFFIFLSFHLPKYTLFLRTFTIFFMADTLFRLWEKKRLSFLNRPARIFLFINHWFVYILAALAFLVDFLVPFIHWPIPLRTYLVSVVLMLVIMKIPHLTVWPFAMVFNLIRSKFFRTGSTSGVLPGKIPGWLIFCRAESLVIMVVLVYGMAIGQHDVIVKEHFIRIDGLPDSFKGYRIVQISDIHVGSCTSRDYLAGVVRKINSLNPDVVLVTGDMFNYRTSEGYGFEPIFQELRARDGVYAILGNHDYGDYISWDATWKKRANELQVVSWYRETGWQLLKNENRIIKRGTDSIAIIGVENWGATRRFQRKGDIEKAVQGVENMAVQILMSHDPSHWDSIISKSYPAIDLTLSGHTHGGQVGIDIGTFQWGPSSWAYPYWMGLYRKPTEAGSQYLYVNPGLGTVAYAGRIGIKPEISLIILE
jgi:predicted MPP superfamily phosphohydrolase